MSPEITGIVGFCALMLLLGLKVPVGVALAFVGGAGTAYLGGFKMFTYAMGNTAYSATSSYTLSVLPLFTMMGIFTTHSGVSAKLFNMANAVVGHLRGGLAMGAIGASAGFGAICGSSMATTATMAKITLPEMQRYNYDMRLAAGSIVAGGTLAIMIPPSLALAMYGILTQNSIGSLYISGFIPGIIGAILYGFAVAYVAHYHPERAPRGEVMTFRERLKAILSVFDVVLLFGLVLGGMFGGYVSVTEGAATGVAGALIISLYRGKLTWKNFKDGIDETASTVGMLFVILIGATTFAFFIDLSNLPSFAVSFVGQLSWPPMVILIIIMFIYIVLGCIMDGLAIMLITIPVVYPVIQHLGIHPIWFGILMVTVSEVGMISPPFGMNLFVLQAVRPDVSFATIVDGVWPFIYADIVRLGLLLAFPILSLIMLPT